MRRKPSAPQQKRWQDYYDNLEFEDTKVRFYKSGMIIFDGSVKNASIAFAKFALENLFTLSEVINFECIRLSVEENNLHTIEWSGGGVIPDDILPEPKYWEEFKREFERYCELKAFL